MNLSATVGVVWKQESARIVAGLLRLVHDVGLAEELAQDALVAALEQWPVSGLPDNPGAWLTAIAKRRAVDHIRRSSRVRSVAEIAGVAGASEGFSEAGSAEGAGAFGAAGVSGAAGAFGEPADDDVLRLMFISCHPVLPTDARVALTLRVVAGLTPAEIARAFLTGEAVIAQRIAAAKRTLSEAGIAYGLPAEVELSSVLEVVYLIFNEGYAASSGADLIRSDLCLEALRLGRLLAELAPGQAEVHGLVALMEIQQSRSAARTGPAGEPIQLHEQNRGRWDRLLINRGFAAMLRAREALDAGRARDPGGAREPGGVPGLGGVPGPGGVPGLGGAPGPYLLQAAIAVCHAQARTAAETDWARIAALYETLERVLPTPVVRLNRAVAVGFAGAPQAGLDLLDEVRSDAKLAEYHLLPGVRGDLLIRLGRPAEARLELERAASLTGNAAERDFLLGRASALPAGAGPLLGPAVDEFLSRFGPVTARAYGQTLRRVVRVLGDRTPIAALTADRLREVFAAAWPGVATNSWNRHVAAARSFTTWAEVAGLAAGLASRPVSRSEPDRGVAPAHEPGDHPVRERALWSLLRESGAPIGVALGLNVEDLDLDDRSAHSGTVVWRSRTARLLPELIGGRARGPLFLSDRRPGPGRRPAETDLCPETGRRRLSYERAEFLCKRLTGHTLRAFRPPSPSV